MNDAASAIRVERSGRQGVYLLRLPDADPARLTFSEIAPGHIAIDYSFVPPRYRGRGVALELIRRAVADAREQGFRITPLCGYVAAEFRRHPEWADVLAGRPPAA
ncbi:GNAT family N-acetyltransferase [Mesorhizobium sp. ZMM04-5]|uniref:GNAT family N-acetyltransferase n=1 Tax=Mesorhizobium marinum TaxID=3228790 RepID=A0ABV3QXL3_9HYPH